MSYFKIFAAIALFYTLLFIVISDNNSIRSYFTRFELTDIDHSLDENSTLLKDMDIDEIYFKIDNYTGNSAGKQALSFTVYLTSDNEVAYLSDKFAKLNGMKAVLKNDKWVIYGNSNTKEHDKQVIKDLLKRRVDGFIKGQQKIHENKAKWFVQAP